MRTEPPGSPAGSPLGRVPAPLLVLVAIGSVQTGSAVARTLFAELGSTGVTLLRLGLAAVFLLIVVRPKVSTWSRTSWGAAALLGCIFAGMNTAFYLSLRTVPLGVAVTVEFIGPLTLALVQTRRWLDVLWAVLAACGVVLLGVDSASGIPVSGLLLALTAGMFWAVYILASARVGRLLPGIDGLAVALAVGALLVLPFGLKGAAQVVGHPSWLLTAAAVALLSSVIPYGLELTALRRLPTRVFGILMSAEPAAAAIAGFLVLGQQLLVRQMVALVLVSAASIGVTVGRHQGGQQGELPPQPLE
ncbi:MAG: EamA family transporter [Actinomycetes bacterium]